MKNKKKIINTIAIIIAFYTIVGLVLPFIFKYVIFESTAFSNLSNNEWAGFLGSYVGGILGGLGTLLSLFITVKDSRDMQAENKRDTDEKIRNDRAEREQEQKANRLAEAKKERNRFTEDIAVYIGKYITDISKYYYACQNSERIHSQYNDVRGTLNNIDHQILKINEEIEKHAQNNDFSSVQYTELQQKKIHLLENQHILKRRFEEVSKEKDKNYLESNRLVANECYFILKTKLYDITEANGLLNQLKFIHNKLFDNLDYNALDQNWIGKNNDLLMDEYYKFKMEYVNKH